MSAPILPLTCSQRPVFLVNSRQGPFTAAQNSFPCVMVHRFGRSFSRSYGSILPSSLTRVLPRALVSSTYLPVSVCGTDTSTSSFSRFSRRSSQSLIAKHTITARSPRADFPTLITDLPAWNPHYQQRADSLLRVPASLHKGSTGILACCPSPTTFVLSLGPTNPTWTTLPSEPLDFRRA